MIMIMIMIIVIIIIIIIIIKIIFFLLNMAMIIRKMHKVSSGQLSGFTCLRSHELSISLERSDVNGKPARRFLASILNPRQDLLRHAARFLLCELLIR